MLLKRCVQAAGRGSMEGAITQLRYQCGECAQCGDKCANTVFASCGSVRRCSDDTVTRGTSVQGKGHTRNSWRHFRWTDKNSYYKK